MRNTPFGVQQIRWLKDIVNSPSGITQWRLVAQLRGRSKASSYRYIEALEYAILRHNKGVCPSNCPVPADVIIEEGEVGPQGGKGWRVVSR